MCIHCQLNSKRPKINEEILITCRNTNVTYCTDSRFDSTIQNLISMIPLKYHTDKVDIVLTLLHNRITLYNHLLDEYKEYTISMFIRELNAFVNIFNRTNCTRRFELIETIDLLKREEYLEIDIFPIIDKIPIKKRSFTGFKKKYTWVNSKFYKLIKKIF